MVRRGFYLIALTAALIPLAVAQNYNGTPKPTVQDYGPFGNVPSKITTTNITTKSAAGECGNPAEACLFYGGDFLFDPLYPSSLPNGLANETTLSVPGTPYGAATWVPFTVPKGQTWAVTGLFSNNLTTYGVLDQGTEPRSVAYWSINEGLYPGNGGTLINSGTSAATSTPTGHAAFGLQEYTIQVSGLNLPLRSGSYWMSVVPICSNTANPFCNGVFFMTDVEYLNTTPALAFGPPEPINAAFFDSPYFGLSFDPTNGSVGACDGDGCSAFSAGVLGTKQ
jgi:hypothetical protein